MAADGPKLTPLGKVVIFLFIVGCFAGAYYMFRNRAGNPLAKQSGGSSSSSGGGFLSGGGPSAEIGIAYGTEKRRWLEWAVQEFTKTSQGRNVKVNLIPMGSIDGAHALTAGDQRINAWTPASAAYTDVFVQDWQGKYNTNPFVRSEPLALTPMVFVMWEERYQAFIQKYKTVSLETIADAEQEKSGWDGIAGKPDWGFFKFGHTNPNESNSGLMTLVLAAYTYNHKTKGLDVKDIVNAGFQDWLQKLERGVAGMSDSTGNMMRDMVLKGPSSYDALFVYESVTIDYLKNAEGRWGALRIVYPEYNAWNESPYYVLNAPWSTPDQRKAADAFLNFLLTDSVQKQSLIHGFRPANPNVPVKFADSPFTLYAKYGIQVDLQKVCEPPKALVVTNLLTGWQRMQGSR